MPPSAPSGAVRLAAPPRGVVAVVVLLLRAGIGLELLTRGLQSYWLSHARNGGAPFVFDASLMAPGAGIEAASHVLPYLDMAVGLAVLAGFFTVHSAAAAGAALLLPALMQVAMMLVMGSLQAPNMRNSLMSIALSNARAQALTPVILLMWLASTGPNPLSFDAWIGLGHGPQAGPSGPASETPSATDGG